MCPGSKRAKRGQTEAERFATYLSELKERGSSLLVVGELPRAYYTPFCSNMFGDPTSGPRCRLRVTTREDTEMVTQFENEITASEDRIPTRHIVSTFDARSAARVSPVVTDNETVRHVEGGDLTLLGIAFSDEIQRFEERRGGLEPAELRVCFDSLRPFVEEYDEEQVFRFLDLLSNRIKSTGGMGHFHLQIASDDPLVNTLGEVFDAVIELGRQDDELMQCWQIEDPDISSGWIPV